MDNAHAPYELDLVVRPEDIDQLNHVNNVVYLKWVQEAAIAHWTLAAPADVQKELFWVIARHEIDYKRPALLGDGIIARTWVGPATHRTFERFTEILRASDRTLLARARTFWCPMSFRTGRATTVSEDVRAAFSQEPVDA